MAGANDKYSEEVTATLNRIKEFATGIAKTATTDLPGLAMDFADRLTGTGQGVDRSAELFKKLTGIESTGSAQEMLGSFMNPENAAKAMIVGAVRKSPSMTRGAVDLLIDAQNGGDKITPAALYNSTGVYETSLSEPLKSVISDKPSRIKAQEFFKASPGDGHPEAFFVRDNLTVDNVLDHPELFSMYPELRKIKVDIAPGSPGEGYYNPSKNVIGLAGNPDLEGIRSTILHELQHGVQRIEGFKNGTNIDAMMDPKMYAAQKKLEIKRQELVKEGDKAKIDAFNRFQTKIKSERYQASNKYLNNAGEQEARFTQQTRDLTEVELASFVLEQLKHGVNPQNIYTVNLNTGIKLSPAQIAANSRVR